MSRFPHKLIFWIGAVHAALFIAALCPGVLHADSLFTTATRQPENNTTTEPMLNRSSVVRVRRDSLAPCGPNQSAGSCDSQARGFSRFFTRASNTGATTRPTLPADCAILI